MLPLYILFLPDWIKLPWKYKVLTPIIVILTFIATFIPLAIWDIEALFHKYNPFILQSRQGHIEDVVIMLVVTTILALRTKNTSQYFFYSGIVLILLPTIAYGNKMIQSSEPLNIFDSWCDITYLDTSIPFLVMSILLYNRK